ncbi:hypothetical protein LJR143_003456 [Pseudoxanthomonas sp. LjRoot143]|uniref:hypothetical protein n=1 Tax=unclassified Pseudoxanthomonas TaxID=2645906 RepID=UPI00177B5727|nr:hypothetical protein [Pseudoxanthomonas sp. PXM01]MBD9470601.1 hypothetical protein [Pseudoxanthomonas sp. PXM01]
MSADRPSASADGVPFAHEKALLSSLSFKVPAGLSFSDPATPDLLVLSASSS